MVRIIAGVFALAIGLAAPAMAGHVEPKSAKKAIFPLVNSYFECSSPNTVTQTNGTDACAPAFPEGFSGCMLTAAGSGTLSLSVAGNAAAGTQVLKVSASVKGLSGSVCEGQQYCVTLSYRATSDDCAMGSCTVFDIENIEANGSEAFGTCCTVADGACKLKGTINVSNMGFTHGTNAGLELHGCGLKPAFPFGAQPALACGILVP